ncbi:hypothetical protein K8T06_02085 [bacterium]|nr:hypothetical protein [bacterium]
MNQEFRILVLILAALFIGIAVLIFKPDYRIPENLTSNISYYPDATSATATPSLNGDIEIHPTDDKDDTIDLGLQQDFEF